MVKRIYGMVSSSARSRAGSTRSSMSATTRPGRGSAGGPAKQEEPPSPSQEHLGVEGTCRTAGHAARKSQTLSRRELCWLAWQRVSALLGGQVFGWSRGCDCRLGRDT